MEKKRFSTDWEKVANPGFHKELNISDIYYKSCCKSQDPLKINL